MADREPVYRSSIPEFPIGCYLYRSELIADFDEDGERKSFAFEPPDRWRQVVLDEWLFEWGDIGGFDVPVWIPLFMFEHYVEASKQQWHDKRKAEMDGAQGRRLNLGATPPPSFCQGRFAILAMLAKERLRVAPGCFRAACGGGHRPSLTAGGLRGRG